MTYENALEWAIRRAPPEDFDSFEDWYNTIEDKLNAPYLFSSSTFNRMVEREWIERFGSLDASSEEPEFEEPEEIIQSSVREIEVYDNRDLRPRVIDAQITVSPVTGQPINIEPVRRQEEIIKLPPTGKAPEILAKTIQQLPPQQKQSLLRRFIGFFRRKRNVY